MRYLVFIKREYVRDSQAFTGKAFKKDDLGDLYSSGEAEDGWQDIEGDILVADINCETEEELFKRIGTIYPKASHHIFRVFQLSDAEEINLRERAYFK